VGGQARAVLPPFRSIFRPAGPVHAVPDAVDPIDTPIDAIDSELRADELPSRPADAVRDLDPAVRLSSRPNRGVPASSLDEEAASRLLSHVGLVSSPASASDLPPEPRTFKAAMRSDEASEWKGACDDEYDSLLSNQTWRLTPLPVGRRAISSRWVFKRKLAANGSVSRHKARLVAKGYEQTPGVDFHETFSPVASYSSIRLVLAIAGAWSLLLHQMDVVCAFLQGPIDYEIYVRQPEGYVVPGKEDLVCRLLRALYGLRQSPRCWWQQLDGFLLQLGFHRCLSESCIYVLRRQGQLLIIAVYVDDLVIACSCELLLEWIKSELSSRFRMKDEGVLSWCLGMKISRPLPTRITLDLEQYTTSFLDRAGMRSAKPAPTPAAPGVVLSADDCPQTAEREGVHGLLSLSCDHWRSSIHCSGHAP
jgi:hypothetical protein